jgi:N-acetylneuraminic acid mutarotase
VQAVTISDSTPGAFITYVIDGNPPAAAYTSPIQVSASETITAIAAAPGYANSNTASAVYTVTTSPAAAPVFAPASGTYNGAQSVTINDTSPGAAIYYTTDGSAPSPASSVYQGPITVSSSQVVQAIAIASGVPNSAVSSAVYTIGTASTLGEWAWMGGSNQPQQFGRYGNYGMPGTANIPGARQSSTTWKDASGNFWLFAGAGYDGRGYTGYLNDLWEFNPSSQQWTWRGGSNLLPCNNGIVTFTCGGVSGVYGTLGNTAAANVPGGRFGAAGWVDSKGRLWLFGGEGVDVSGVTTELNDLWMFDPSSSQWTWMGGSNKGVLSFYSSLGQPGIYGELGVPSASNIPGSRYDAATWVDAQGNFWLFGGTGQDGDGLSTLLNDLWMFNPATLQWVWVGGSSVGVVDVGYIAGAYGTLGQPAAGNYPGSRSGAAAWTDGSGNVWLYGGQEGDVTGYSNDLWKYEPSSNQWAWMAGASVACSNENYPDSACTQHTAAYGALGIPGSGSTPGGGPVNASWTDKQGNFWLLGGNNPIVNGTNGGDGYGLANELWAFNPSTGLWTWMGGDYLGNCSWIVPIYPYPACGIGALYGNSGVPAPGNIPAARFGGAGWTDANGNLWLFGGAVGTDAGSYSVGNANDLWEYQPSPATLPPAASPIFTFTPQPNQPSGQLSFANDMANATFFYTTDGSTPTTASTPYRGPITVSTTETVSAMAAAPGYRNSVVTSTNYTVNPAPPAPAFSVATGAYTSIQTVTISDTNPNATIYYTTDGSTPVATSPVYSGPIAVSASETISALATAYGTPGTTGTFPSNALISPVSTASYTIHLPPAAAPVLSLPAGTYTAQATVTITDANPGAKIYYTTDGTTPTPNSNIYYGPISVYLSGTVEAIAVATGYAESPVVSAAYVIIPMEFTPSFSPQGGAAPYFSPLSITAYDNDPSATIYYTTDGTTPTTSSNVYHGQIVLTGSAIVQAIAVRKGYANSAVATAKYTLLPVAAAPVFSLPAGAYGAGQSISISDPSTGVTIYYTTDGSTPTSSSRVYNAPIVLSAAETIEAIAMGPGFSSSPVSTAAYSITAAAAGPTFAPPAGNYTSAQTVGLSSATAGTIIYYTTDGSTPSANSPVYTTPIVVSASETIHAIAEGQGLTNSPVSTAAYTITTAASVAPTFTPPAGTYASAQTVSIADATAGATIYYTTDGSTPTLASPVYTVPLVVSSSETITAIAAASGYSSSPPVAAAYVVHLPTNPGVVMSSMSPAFTSESGPAFTLMVNGTGVLPGAIVYWGSTVLSTQFISATQLSAQVPAAAIAASGTTTVAIHNPGQAASNALQFEVDSAPAGSTTSPVFSDTSATVKAGASATYPVTLPSSATNVSAACLNLPGGASCSYSPSMGAVTIATASSTPGGTYQVTVVFTETEPGAAAAFALVSLLLSPLLLIGKRIGARRAVMGTLGLILFAMVAGLSGCGGGDTAHITSPSGPTPTHQVTSSGVINLTVQ